MRRMQWLATGLLALMLAIFVATYAVNFDGEWLGYLRAFAQAGMIGACADWFAVVALFRHPLGLPIPHTAIVPNNKQRIGGAIGRFISNNFLSPGVLAARIRKVDMAGGVARWLSNPDNAHRIAHRVASSLPNLLRSLPRDALNPFLARTMLLGIEAVPAAPLASKVLALLWAQGETQALVDRMISFAANALAGKSDLIKVTVTRKSSRFIPKWVDAIVADKIVSGLTQLLEEMRDPGHPWRAELSDAIEKLIDDLAADPEMLRLGEDLKGQILGNPVVQQQVGKLWTDILARLDSAVASETDRIAGGIEHALLAVGQRMTSDRKVQAAFNRWTRLVTLRMVASRRAEIGAFISQVVERWDTVTLVNRIELQVGRDLQYIRINGTLVGGLVGLIVYSVTRWL